MGAVVPMRPETLARIFADPRPAREPFDPNGRSLPLTYRFGEVNHCPACSRSHWHVGRQTAECAFCATALPLRDAEPTAMPRVVVVKRASYADLEGK